jgi:hypothetical protein
VIIDFPLYCRSLSGVSGRQLINETALASNVTVLKHIVTILAGTVMHAVPSEVSQIALDIAVNIANRVDVSGRKRVTGNFSCMEELSSSTSKDMLRLTLSKHMSTAQNGLYLQLTRKLIITTCHLLHNDNFITRFFVHRSLELLAKLLTANEKEPFVRCSSCPDVVRMLTLYLAVSSSRIEPTIVPEGLAAIGDPMGRTRSLLCALPPAVQQPSTFASAATSLTASQISANLKLIPATFLTSDCIDFELRDLAIESLLMLCRSSVANADHLLDFPRATDLLLRIARVPSNNGMVGIGPTSHSSFRTDGNGKAAQLLGTLLGPREMEDFVDNLRSIRTQMLFQTTCDDNFAGMIKCLSPCCLCC